jgi:hypothetical protein
MTTPTEALPQLPTSDKPKINLSPFHWNNLALPVLPKNNQVPQKNERVLSHKNKGYKSTQKHIKSPPKSGTLEPIIEK